MFRNYFKKNKKRIAIIEASNNKRWTYKDLLIEIDRFNTYIEKNSLVILIGTYSFFSIIGYLGCLSVRNKSTTILIDETFNKDLIDNIISKYKPNYIFYPDNYKFKMNFYKNDFFENYILSKTFNKKTKINLENKLLLTTSGTTGSSKLVRLSTKNLLTNAKSIIKSLSIKKSHTAMTTMPIGYSYGISILNSHFFSGAKIILNKNNIFQKNFWEYFNKYKVNSLNGVPAFYEYIKKLKLEKLNLKNLLYISQAGGKMEYKTKKYIFNYCKNLNIKFYIMYGQTEASPRISCFEVSKYPKKINSVGKSIESVNIEINKEKNTKTVKKMVGEIFIKGRNVCLGYANNIKDLKKGDENKGFLKTGDIGYLDNDKFLYINGRINKFTKLFGYRINLDDIEKFLSKKKFICKCWGDDKQLYIEHDKSTNLDKIKKLVCTKYKFKQQFVITKKVKKLSKKIILKGLFNG